MRQKCDVTQKSDDVTNAPWQRPNEKMTMPKVGVVAWVSPIKLFPFYCAFEPHFIYYEICKHKCKHNISVNKAKLKPNYLVNRYILVYIYYHTKDVHFFSQI